VRRSLVLLGFLLLSSSARHVFSEEAPGEAKLSPIPRQTRQILVVRTASWASVSGTLERYERDEGGGHWVLIGEKIPLNVGRSGMGWGRGLVTTTSAGPTKREGDGRSPAGVFALGEAFGAAEHLPEGAKNFPYRQAQNTTFCIEDTRSKLYNQIVEVPGVTPGSRPGWSELKRADGLFRWGIIVKQNEPEPQVGAGSCVFMHIWRGAGRGTAGCTAMPDDALERTLRWLDPSASPVLVQLPEPVYESLREAWALP